MYANWGYDGVLPFARRAPTARPTSSKRSSTPRTRAASAVLLDVVYNHFGPEGNYLHAYAKPFFTERHQTPWGAAINLDGEGAPIVRELFVQNALYWLREYRFDGLRLDAVHEIRDDSPHPFLEELAARVRAGVEPGRHVHLVLENDANGTRLLERYDAPSGTTTPITRFTSCSPARRSGTIATMRDEPARLLARSLAEGFAYQGEPSAHRGNAPRGEPSAALPTTAVVDFLQNHDQIGNRAFGERIGALAPVAAVRAATAVLLLAPAIPLLFMGEEWSASTPFLFFCDFGPELALAVTEGRRREFAGWPGFRAQPPHAVSPDPQDPATMRASVLRWDERSAPEHAAALALHAELLALRHGLIVPRLAGGGRGDGYALIAPAAVRLKWRFGDESRLALIANLGPEPATVSYAIAGTRIFTVGDVPARADEAVLAPWSVGWFLDS